jgi:Sulfatase
MQHHRKLLQFSALVIVRLFTTAVFLLTAAYATLNCSPFAFDMFIRPQLSPWLTWFVSWHHVFYCVAFAATVITLLPELTMRGSRLVRAKIASWLAWGYVALFGTVAVWICARPFLPALWNDRRALPTALLAFLPLAWLAAIDHLSAWPAARAGTAPVTNQRRLLAACVGAMTYIWIVHSTRALILGRGTGGFLPWAISLTWALVVCATVFAILYAVFGLARTVAARRRQPGAWEYALTVAILGAGICEFLKRTVFPTFSLPSMEAASISAAAAIALAATWSGLTLRRPAGRPKGLSALEWLVTPPVSATVALLGALALGPIAALTLQSMARLDWDFAGQRTIVVLECCAGFALMLRATRGLADRAVSRAAWILPILALVGLFAVPPMASGLASWTGDGRLLSPSVLDRHAGAETTFRLMSDALVTRAKFDTDYYRYLQVHADFSGRVQLTVPDIDFAPMPRGPRADRPPDIFLIVIDSLRRDYLSPYNPAVTFTPNIDAFAHESFVFRNAFTRHGGTELAMPSIFAGGMTVRRAVTLGFERMNAIEKLVETDGYRVAINDFTVAEYLRASTPVTTIDPGVPSVQTDLCRNLESLEAHLDHTASDTRPILGYFAPMNVHILNTRRGGQRSLDGEYPGFYAPYASRLKRADACFGEFITYLKQHGRYDNSIIVLTGDHGDSLGEDGYWGHAMWLFPEDVRLPLLFHVPDRLKAALTTDLTRVAFSTDIAPSLYGLLGHPVRDLGPIFGAPLFVRRDSELVDRRRAAFLLTSSYGATYALLRRNGRVLFVTDLAEWREFAFDLSSESIRARVDIDQDLRRVNEREIRNQVAALSALYGFAR